MKRFLFVFSTLLILGLFCACSSSDEIDIRSSDDSTDCNSNEEMIQDGQCYTIHINGIDEHGVVSGSLINKPQETTFNGHTIVLFDISDLPDLNISSGDEVDIKILSYKEIPTKGFTSGETYYYYCKVSVCK